MLDFQPPKFTVVFAPMGLALFVGWLLSRLYFERRGKHVIADVVVQKISLKEKVHTLLVILTLISIAGMWSILIAFLF